MYGVFFKTGNFTNLHGIISDRQMLSQKSLLNDKRTWRIALLSSTIQAPIIRSHASFQIVCSTRVLTDVLCQIFTWWLETLLVSPVPSASSHRPLGQGDASLGACGSSGHVHPSMSMLQVWLAARACFVFAFWLCQVQPRIILTVGMRGVDREPGGFCSVEISLGWFCQV